MFRILAWSLVIPVATKATELKPIQAFFRNHCVECHGKDDKIKGKVDLRGWLQQPVDTSAFQDLQAIKDVLTFGEMPPEEAPNVAPPAREDIIDRLTRFEMENSLEVASSPKVSVRRMNRFQYNNAVVDLLDLQGVVYALPERILRDHDGYFQPQTGKMPTVVKVGCRPLGKSQLIEKRLGGVAPFPQDLRAEHGFDNRSDHLSLSPLLLEGFLRLAQSIVESPDFRPDRVGIWMQCFAPPPEDQDMQEAVAVRLRPLMRKAFRGNADEETYQRYIDYALKQWRSGNGFTDSMKAALAAILSSPRFLYLYQEAPVETTLEDASLKGLELASRLSFFLWGSLPDEPLLEAALNGELVLDQGLEKQFHRMLSHPRLKRFCDSFPSQWLQLDRIISSAPDKESFPGFYFLKYRDSMHMVLEPLLLFETVLIENLSISQFIQSNFTYRSKLLQEAYGELGIGEKPIQGNQEVTVLRFERYPVEDPRIGGLITNAAVMTMTSGPEDTKPITRGSWMATVFFNRPPEPPPADVPPLSEEKSVEAHGKTIRERLQAHREQAQCRGCHEKIDPFGFALENYSPIGTWRDQYANGRKIDMEGILFGQEPFHDIKSFKASLLNHQDRFAHALSGHLMSFALARPLEPSDQAVLSHIIRQTAPEGHRLQDLIQAIVMSKPFRSGKP